MKKPTIGEKIANKHLDCPAYPETGKHIESREALADAIDRAIRKAFRDGREAAHHERDRMGLGLYRADKLATKYGVKL